MRKTKRVEVIEARKKLELGGATWTMTLAKGDSTSYQIYHQGCQMPPVCIGEFSSLKAAVKSLNSFGDYV